MRPKLTTEYLSGRTLETLRKQREARLWELKQALQSDELYGRAPSAYTEQFACAADRLSDEIQGREIANQAS